MACKALIPRCSSACNFVVKGLSTATAGMGVPIKCIADLAKRGCIAACNKLCSRRLSTKRFY